MAYIGKVRSLIDRGVLEDSLNLLFLPDVTELLEKFRNMPGPVNAKHLKESLSTDVARVMCEYRKCQGLICLAREDKDCIPPEKGITGGKWDGPESAVSPKDRSRDRALEIAESHLREAITWHSDPEAYALLLKVLEKRIDLLGKQKAKDSGIPVPGGNDKSTAAGREPSRDASLQGSEEELVSAGERYLETLKKLDVPEEYEEFVDKFSRKLRKISGA